MLRDKMKIKIYLISFFIIIFLFILKSFNQGILIYLIYANSGLIVYNLFKNIESNNIDALKKTSFISLIITILITAEILVLNKIFSKITNLSLDSNFSGMISIYNPPNTIFLIGLILIFILTPTILFLLERLSKREEKKLYKNPWIVLLYVITTLGIYQIYWFWFIKKGLNEENINTISLWWFLLPFIGTILIYIDFSKALEKKTKRKFIKWFLIFLFFQGLDVVINQIIINKNYFSK
jgi:hypothetical protein